MKIGPPQFLPIDLNKHQDTCIRFREDSFVASFGDTSRFYEADGKGHERYIEWLRSKISQNPRWAVHIWNGNEIIGQLEMGRLKDDPKVGNVNLYYLVPNYRGVGFSQFLDEYAVRCLREEGCLKARLNVSPTNRRAIGFYEKMGWMDIGPRLDHPEVHWMEKNL